MSYELIIELGIQMQETTFVFCYFYNLLMNINKDCSKCFYLQQKR